MEYPSQKGKQINQNSEINTSIGNENGLPEIEVVKGQNNSNSDIENDSLNISEITLRKNTNQKKKPSNNQKKQRVKNQRNQHLDNPRTQSINKQNKKTSK